MQTSPVTPFRPLKPNKILQYVTDSEEEAWKQAGITQTRDDLCNKETLSIGKRILRHGKTVKLIHNYFGDLEPRKCCLHLTSCKTTFSNVRLVRNDGRDSGIEEGAMMRTPVDNNITVNELDENDFQVFRYAYLCASLPVLGAPEPPSALSPSPVFTPTDSKRRFHFTEAFHQPPTPTSLQDSGVEDQDDTSIVPAESLRELLMRTFRLTSERFYYYEQRIANMYHGKQAERILAEELVGQLAALENNNNPFYSPDSFMHTQGYDKWQRWEFLHIGGLMKKFWHHSYPPPSNQYIHFLKNVHTDYRILMEKLIRYESPYRQAGEFLVPGQTSPLSTTSVRLLKEFGLRYGIGEFYRRIVYLHYLVNNFDATVWFIQHTGAVLSGILDILPKRGSVMVLVKKEHALLQESIQTLETQVISALVEMKSLFPNNKPAEGLESLIQLISRTLLARKSTDKLENFLLKNVKNIFPTCYNREKMVVMTDLSNSSNNANTDLSPTLLNLMIGKIRDEVNDYKLHYQSTFEKFFDVTREAAQSLYKLLMDDVKLLCHRRLSNYSSLKIDKLMLGLGYRLHQLDQEWTMYITTEMQTWREVFVKEEVHWSVAMKVHLQSMVVKSVSQDDFDTENVAAIEFPSSSDSSMIYQRVRTVSTKSLTPSYNSAFSGLVLSSHSTPDNQKISRQSSRSQSQIQFPTIPESDQVHSPPPRKTLISDSDLNQNFSDLKTSHCYHVPSSMSRRRRQQDYNFETQSLETYLHSPEELVSFTCLRQSSSLPDVLSKSYDHTLNVPRMFTKDPLHDNQNGSSQFNGETENKHHSEEDVQNLLSSQTKQVGLGEDKDSLAGEFSGSNSEDTLTDPRDEDFTASERSDSGEGYSYPPIKIVSMDKKQMEATAMSLTSQGQSSKEKHGDVNMKVLPTMTANKTKDEIARTYQEMKDTSSMLQIPTQGQISDFHQYHSLSDSGDHSQDVETSIPVSKLSSSSNPADRLEVPVSSSLVDLISMMQRLVGFSHVICQTFCPLNTPTLAPIEDDVHSFSSSLDDVTTSYSIMSDTRQNLYNNFFDALSNTLCVYGDNLLCMDLCGTTLSVARKLVGPQLVEYLMTQQDGGLVCGCRHDNMEVKNCFFYINRKTDFLCDRYEPITRDMCTRINNVAAVLEYLDVFHSDLGKAFNVYNDWRVYHRRQNQPSATPQQSNDYEIVENFSYNPESDRHVVMETASQITNTTTSSVSSHSVIVQTPTKPCHDHLKAVLRALSRLMAYRLNLFASDALRVLLGLKHHEEPIQTCLQPLTKFLQMYINSLQSWLYPDCFRRVVECLWIFIVQDFEEEVKKLMSDENTETKARILIQALSHLLWFITQQDQSIGKNLLLSQAEDVMFKLQLYTESTSQLITLFRGLQRHYAFSDSSSTYSIDGAVQVMLHRMRKDLQVYCKCFSGHALVEWIMTNPKLFANIWEHHISVENLRNNQQNCFAVAQWLLDQGLIVDMITELENPYETTMLLNSCSGHSEEDEYPALSIHSSMHGVTSGDSDNDTPRGSPQASQRNSPVPTTRNQGSRVGTPVHRSRPSSRAPNLLQKCLSRKDTPLPKFENLSGKPGDFSFASVTSSLSEVSQIECADGSIHPDQVKALTSSSGGNYVNGGSLHGDDITVCGGAGAELRGVTSLNESRGFMTPRLDSMLENVIFQHDKCHFYHIATVLGSGLHKDNDFTSTRDMFELNSLIEQCFLKKIVPDYILTILYSRRKEDPGAKAFSQKILDDPSHKFSINKQQTSTCVTS